MPPALGMWSLRHWVTSKVPDPHLFCLLAQACPTLCNPRDCSSTRLLCPPDCSGKNTGRGLSFPLPGALPGPGIEPTFLVSPVSASRFFTHKAIREAPHFSSVDRHLHLNCFFPPSVSLSHDGDALKRNPSILTSRKIRKRHGMSSGDGLGLVPIHFLPAGPVRECVLSHSAVTNSL